jgi:hypothetical protein
MQTKLLWRLWWSPASGTRRSVLCWCVGRNVASKMFSRLIYLEIVKTLTFSAICKVNAMNCITVRHETGSSPSTLTGHTMLVHFITPMFFRRTAHLTFNLITLIKLAEGNTMLSTSLYTPFSSYFSLLGPNILNTYYLYIRQYFPHTSTLLRNSVGWNTNSKGRFVLNLPMCTVFSSYRKHFT